MSADVQKKLKAAIARRLRELDVLMDDELPDYIMVMVANKKDSKAMRSDLNLFLGENTDKFVDWLFEVIARLNSAGAINATIEEKPKHAKSKEDDKKLDDKGRKLAKRGRDEPSPTHEKDRAKKAREQEHHEKDKKESEKKHRDEAERKARKEREEQERSERHRKEKELREKEKKEKEREKAKEKERKVREQEAEDELQREKQKELEKEKPLRRVAHSEEDVRPKVASVVQQRPEEAPPTVCSTVVVKRNVPKNDENSRSAFGVFQRAVAQANTSSGVRRKIQAPQSNLTDALNETEDLMHEAVVSAQRKSETKGPTFTVTMNSRMRLPQKRTASHFEGQAAEKEGSQSPKKTVKRERITGPEHSTVVKLMNKHLESSTEEKRPVKGVKEAEPPIKKSNDAKVQEEVAQKSPSDPDQGWNGKIVLESGSEEEHDTYKAAKRVESKNTAAAIKAAENLKAILAKPAEPEPVYIPTPIVKPPAEQSYNVAPVVKERCKFWPDCTRGTSCCYVHPNKACSNFPMCSFGQSCLYIHPPCKFNRNCQNVSCAYTHTTAATFPDIVAALMPAPPAVKRAPPKHVPSPVVTPAASAVSSKESVNAEASKNTESQDAAAKTEKSAPPPSSTAAGLTVNIPVPTIPCKFGSRCKNTTCTFKHPPPCKYGNGCLNAACTFYHGGSLPAKTFAGSSAYKWQAPKVSN